MNRYSYSSNHQPQNAVHEVQKTVFATVCAGSICPAAIWRGVRVPEDQLWRENRRGVPGARGVVDTDIDIHKKDVSRDIVEDATFFTICRNSDLSGIKSSIESLEQRFNKHHHYPWVFANDEPFSEEFRKTVIDLVSGDVTFTTIPKEYWDVPSFIDQSLMEQQLKLLELDGVLYGGNLSYRKMCRFNSGFFYKLQALAKYNWYWRVEPNVKYSCEILEDPFRTMIAEDKVYGFVLAMTEDKRTVRKLWKTSRDYFEKLDTWNVTIPEGGNYEHIDDTSLGFIEQNTDTNMLVRGDFNYCHYWSNFEIGNLNFFRDPVYENYFQALDRTGNFFYERWEMPPSTRSPSATCFHRRRSSTSTTRATSTRRSATVPGTVRCLSLCIAPAPGTRTSVGRSIPACRGGLRDSVSKAHTSPTTGSISPYIHT